MDELRKRAQKTEEDLEQKESELYESTRMCRKAEETAAQLTEDLEVAREDLREYKTRATTLLKAKEAEMEALSNSTVVTHYIHRERGERKHVCTYLK